ncbi:MAG: N-acetyl-gamma-glutamyl-phosphate reductase [Spirochaetales bacterium]|nr:N-acetyl-gamma-glutamyl-phosphate reductase [Spirochaetales bacterium]
MKQPVAILGAAGLTGRELILLFSRHPHLEAAVLTSDKYAGERVARVYPELDGICSLAFQKHTLDLPQGCPVLLATPDDVALQAVPELLSRGHRIVDLSGAFRLEPDLFLRTYGKEHPAPEALKEAVYGLPEIQRDRIRKARLVANPGCFPTGCVFILHRLAPFLGEALAVVVDAKSGVSGAGGRTEDAGFAYQNVYENFRAYKVLRHQHNPEIQLHSQSPLPVVFVPHLLPLYRGILSTIYLIWKEKAPDVPALLQQAALAEVFVRYRETPEEIELKKVQNSNYLDLSCRSQGNTTTIVSAIDNLLKGAAGQALQNLNLMLDFEEEAGLLRPVE